MSPWATDSPGSCSCGDAGCPSGWLIQPQGDHPNTDTPPPYLTSIDATSVVAVAVVSSSLIGKPEARGFATGCPRLDWSLRTAGATAQCGHQCCPRAGCEASVEHTVSWIIAQRGIKHCKRPTWALLKCHQSSLTRLQKPVGGMFPKTRGEPMSSAPHCASQPLPTPVPGLFSRARAGCMGVLGWGATGGSLCHRVVSLQKLENPQKALWSHSSGGKSARGEKSNKNLAVCNPVRPLDKLAAVNQSVN